MKLISFLTSLLATSVLGSPAPIAKRDGTTVIDGLNTIGDLATVINTVVGAYVGGLGSEAMGLNIQLQLTQICILIETVVIDARNAPTFTSAQSTNAEFAYSQAGPKLETLATTIGSKEEAFEKGLLGFISITFLIKDDLIRLTQSLLVAGDALVGKLAPADAANALVIQQTITGAFFAAIRKFD